MSVVDLSQIPMLVEAYNNAGLEALTYAGSDSNFFYEFHRAALKAENYGGNNNSEGYSNMVDIGDLIRKSEELLPQSGDELLEALDKAVVYQVVFTIEDGEIYTEME